MSVAISDKDFAELLGIKASAGDPEFLFQVGLCYHIGAYIERNRAEAVKWYRPASEKGHAQAQRNLGAIFFEGAGVNRDYKEAVKWFELSAKQGNGIAQRDLAVCYENGNGVAQDYKEAIRLYTLSAQQGYSGASERLGAMYYEGKGVERDLAQAKKHYEKAQANALYGYKYIQQQIDKINIELRRAARREVFISYSHKDKPFVDELRPHLELLKKTTKINWWDDTRIKPGEKWDEKIKDAMAKAKVAVLMVSAHFFASEYVWNEELPKILAAADQEGAAILWLPVSACFYEGTDIAGYQSVTSPNPPLARRDLAERDEVYTDLVKRIREIFKR